jgi:tRNA nucleotidyltransferase (CCA-adding enzyme)
MAYSEKNGLIDFFNGLEDLENKIIRAVGDPIMRFDEDALRMMRAIRFAAQLNFEIDSDTSKAILELNENINNVSIERIRDEFNKIIISNVWYINELINLGLLKEFLPELVECQGVDQKNIHHVFDVLSHILTSANNIENNLYLRLTMVFHDLCKPECMVIDEKGIGHFYGHEEASFNKTLIILKRMKYDNDTIYKVTTLIKYHDRTINSRKSIRKLLNIIGEELFCDLLKVKAADLSAQNPIYHKEGYAKLALIEEKFKEILEKKECFSIKNLEIDGRDLINIGVKQGTDIGKILNHLLEKVIEEPCLNTKESLVRITKKFVKDNLII